MAYTPPSVRETVEHFGLVTLNADKLEQHRTFPHGYKILYEALIEQWIGGVVTISHWDELCL